METAPRNCRFLSLVVVELVLNLAKETPEVFDIIKAGELTLRRGVFSAIDGELTFSLRRNLLFQGILIRI